MMRVNLPLFLSILIIEGPAFVHGETGKVRPSVLMISHEHPGYRPSLDYMKQLHRSGFELGRTTPKETTAELLAKFNVVAESESSPDVFLGVPTTLAAGLLVIWVLVLLEYTAPATALGNPDGFWGPRLFGGLEFTLGAWSYLPAAMLLGAFLMASNLPQPKLKPKKQKLLTVIILVGATSGFLFAFMRFMPDYMALLPSTWLTVALVWSVLSPKARQIPSPPFLPK